jgi:GGDEF domain-containing protein
MQGLPSGVARDRRTDFSTRDRIDDLSPEQQARELKWYRAEFERMQNELGTDELTGLRNRRAFASDEQLPVKAMLDVDSRTCAPSATRCGAPGSTAAIA